MDNYIRINGQRFEMTDDYIHQIVEAWSSPHIKICKVSVGETIKIGEFEFIVLEQFDTATAVILKKSLQLSTFGDTNNYIGSSADKICCDFADTIENIIGKESIVLHNVDLTADDGLTDYGTPMRKCSLLSTTEYREYVYILDQHKLDEFWWLATARSTAQHGDTTWVKCVAPSGYINDGRCIYISLGVRPFLIFKSDIFVSR